MNDHDDERALTLTRYIDAPPHKVYRAWTEPSLLTQWFTPPPYTTPRAELDVRPGGSNLVAMRGPDGPEILNHGVYLEVKPNEKLVVTDAYTRAWEPSAKPFMTLVLTFDPEGQGTRYTARVLHWSAEDKRQHEAMGFHEGWGKATDQLEAVVAKL
ncbi:MAG: polyketide cyclase [Hyphomicrobiales bacterium]|nr:polyketide cyclase [Hyphomicrobiales bacterium]